MQFILLHMVAPAIVTAATITLVRNAAVRIGLVDRPGGRKQHEGNIPLTGGIAMGLSYIAFMLLSSGMDLGDLNLLLGIVVLLLLGVVDDLRDVSAKLKLLWQVLAAVVIVIPNETYILHLGDLIGIGDLQLGAFAPVFTLFAMVGLINAINMTDGIDGLAGSLVVTSTLWMLVVATLTHQPALLPEIMVLLAVTLGFLAYNLRTPLRDKATVFMGDSGSMLLGACLAWNAIQLTQQTSVGLPGADLVPPVVLLWVLGLPVLDTVVLMLRRVRQGRSPFSPGRDHMHHIWTHAGFTIGQTTVILMLINLLLGAVGIAAWQLGAPEWLLFAGYIVVFLLHRRIAKHAWLASKWLRAH